MAGGVEIDRLFDGWERAWSGRDPAAFARVCDPEIHYEDPFTRAPLHGLPALVGHVRRLWRASPDARVNRTGARLSDGRYASAPCRVIGTHTRSLGRFAGSGRAFDVHALVYAELREERLWRVRVFLDAWDAARQLGVLPEPGTAGERALLLLRGFGLRG